MRPSNAALGSYLLQPAAATTSIAASSAAPPMPFSIRRDCLACSHAALLSAPVSGARAPASLHADHDPAFLEALCYSDGDRPGGGRGISGGQEFGRNGPH